MRSKVSKHFSNGELRNGRASNVKFALTIVLLIGTAVAQTHCREHDAQTEAGLAAVEHRWVNALDERNDKSLACILASEFKDSGVYGQLRDRAQVLADLPHRRYATQKLDELEEDVLGTTGIVRGLNHLSTPDGRSLADVRFTDVFVYRDGRWQAVSAQESLVRPSEQKK